MTSRWRRARGRRPRGGTRPVDPTSVASTIQTVDEPSQACIKRTGSPSSSANRTSGSGPSRVATSASTAAPTPSSRRYGLPTAMTVTTGVTTGERACRGSEWRTRCTGRSCARPARTRPRDRSSSRCIEWPMRWARSCSIAGWFCDVGGTIRAAAMTTMVVDLVAVPQQTAWCFAPSTSGGRAGFDRHRGPRRRGVRLGDRERNLTRVHRLDRAHDDAAERIALGRVSAPAHVRALRRSERGDRR